MRVPTYDRKLQLNNSGGGRFLTAQLSPSAMAAPGLALAKVGEKLVDIGMEKQKLQAKSQLQEAETQLQLDMQELSMEALRADDPVAAEQGFEDKLDGLVKNFMTGKRLSASNQPFLSNKLARNEFIASSQRLIGAALIDFRKQNNVRITDMGRANLDTEAKSAISIATNTAADITARAEAYSSIFAVNENPKYGGILQRGSTGGLFDSKAVATRFDDYGDQIVRGTALNLFKGADSATKVAMDIANGKSTDTVLNSALNQLAPDKRQKAISELLTLAKAMDTDKRQRKEADEKAENAALEDKFKSIINIDRANEDEKKVALATHKELLGEDWYTAEKRKQAETILGIAPDADKPGAEKSDKGALNTLILLDQKNELTMGAVNALKDKLTNSDYEQYLKAVITENKEAKTAAKARIAAAFNYQEFKEVDGMSSVSDMAYQEAVGQLMDWTDQNPQATYRQIIDYSKSLITAGKAEFVQAMSEQAVLSLQNQNRMLFKNQPIRFDPERPVASALEDLAQRQQTMPVLGLTKQLIQFKKAGVK